MFVVHVSVKTCPGKAFYDQDHPGVFKCSEMHRVHCCMMGDSVISDFG